MDGKTTKAVTKLEGSKFSFLNLFLQLAAEKKDSKKGAARKFFGPSYFDPTLICRNFWMLYIIMVEEIQLQIIFHFCVYIA